jgi:hypothetical protein
MARHVDKRLAEINGTAPTENPATIYSVALTVQQWDLVVLALGYVRARACPPGENSSLNVIDIFARRVVRRRIKECLREIESTVPDAGSGTLD